MGYWVHLQKVNLMENICEFVCIITYTNVKLYETIFLLHFNIFIQTQIYVVILIIKKNYISNKMEHHIILIYSFYHYYRHFMS